MPNIPSSSRPFQDGIDNSRPDRIQEMFGVPLRMKFDIGRATSGQGDQLLVSSMGAISGFGLGAQPAHSRARGTGRSIDRYSNVSRHPHLYEQHQSVREKSMAFVQTLFGRKKNPHARDQRQGLPRRGSPNGPPLTRRSRGRQQDVIAAR